MKVLFDIVSHVCPHTLTNLYPAGTLLRGESGNSSLGVISRLLLLSHL